MLWRDDHSSGSNGTDGKLGVEMHWCQSVSKSNAAGSKLENISYAVVALIQALIKFQVQFMRKRLFAQFMCGPYIDLKMCVEKRDESTLFSQRQAISCSFSAV